MDEGNNETMWKIVIPALFVAALLIMTFAANLGGANFQGELLYTSG